MLLCTYYGTESERDLEIFTGVIVGLSVPFEETMPQISFVESTRIVIMESAIRNKISGFAQWAIHVP